MTYFEQGAAVMKNMKMIVESIESRAVAELPTRPAQSTKLFGEPLRQVMGRYEETLPIPSQIEHCLQYVEKNGTFVYQKLTNKAYHDAGVYRVPGHAGELDRLKAMLDEGKFPNFDSLEIQNKHHTICGIIKLYIRELPEPLLTFDKFDDFVAVASMFSFTPTNRFRNKRSKRAVGTVTCATRWFTNESSCTTQTSSSYFPTRNRQRRVKQDERQFYCH
jgi:hypothetical protein